jgi:hypothetical protein
MRFFPFIKIYALLIFFLIGLPACSFLGASSSEAISTPLPISSIPDFNVIPPQMCLVADLGMIRVEHPQGNLIAWSPVNDSLAYIASTQESSWNVGDLNQLSAPAFDAQVRLAAQVAGELTWAPDGLSIAYLGLRHSDNLYTIGLAYPDGRASRDLFPAEAAQTDDYSSQKSILEWIDTGRLRVLVSCGLNCLQTYDIGVASGLSTKVGDQLEKNWDMWTPHVYHPATIPKGLASLAGQLNWSWDERHVAYIDEKGSAWVVNVASSTLSPLDIGQYGTATETDWSYDNEYLAIQVDQNLKIFSFQCP